MKQTEIENLESSDQKSFWKEIGKIGVAQERKKDIPFEVKMANGEISNNPEDVMQVWKTAFEKLLNRNVDNTSSPDAAQKQNCNVQPSYCEAGIEISEVKAAIKATPKPSVFMNYQQRF